MDGIRFLNCVGDEIRDPAYFNGADTIEVTAPEGIDVLYSWMGQLNQEEQARYRLVDDVDVYIFSEKLDAFIGRKLVKEFINIFVEEGYNL